jgi:hypothetical protein
VACDDFWKNHEFGLELVACMFVVVCVGERVGGKEKASVLAESL